MLTLKPYLCVIKGLVLLSVCGVFLFICDVDSNVGMQRRQRQGVEGGGWVGSSSLSVIIFEGFECQRCNDCLAVWVLKRSNHAQVSGLTASNYIYNAIKHRWVVVCHLGRGVCRAS